MKERIIKVADWAADSGETVLVTLGLGSCVALVLHDATTGTGAMAHLMLPSVALSQDRTRPGKFPETALPVLLERLAALGAQRSRLRARLVGGASMFANIAAPGTPSMGERNVLAARDALKAARIPVVGEDTGKGHGRSVYFFLADGRLEVRSVAHGTREV
jgi:chemotaxis protein CheD